MVLMSFRESESLLDKRLNSFLSRSFRRKCPSSTIAKTTEPVSTSNAKHSDQEASLEPEEAERGVASWATSFEKLLEDAAGLHTFAEFLKKEFSHENIYFWVACEKYRELTDKSERKKAARDIFDRHLCLGALEPVNVDSHARQVTQEKLGEATPELFMQAQKQIFNLMKFDSYPRFIKSDLYKDCLVRELSGEDLPFPGGNDLDVGLQMKHKENSPKSHSKLKKSRSDAEDCRRKSLLPWHRKNRSKSKDRGESEYNKLRMLHQKQDAEDTVSVRSDVTSSRSSLVSWDLALRGSFSRQSVTSGELPERESCALCRVILPDGATTVVQTRRNECVKDLVNRLLEKRGLHYSSFEVFMGNSDRLQQISLDEDSTSLGAKEVHVEQRVVFRLELPNRKTIGVGESEILILSLPVTEVDNQRLQVLSRSEAWKSENPPKVKSGPTLDEITNRVFEELLQGKADGGRGTSDQGSVRSEDWGSEYSSGILSRLLRRDSAFLDKVKESRVKSKKNGNSCKTATDDSEAKPTTTSKQPLISKWKVGAKLQGRSESDELYEGLKRAQRSRLEDQRGTEINSELPDFLKDKENAPQAGKKIRKLRRPDEANSKFYETSDTPQGLASSHESLLMGANSNKCGCKGDKDSSANLVSRFFDDNFSQDGIPNQRHESDEYFLGRPSSSLVDYKNREAGKVPPRPAVDRSCSAAKPNENPCNRSSLDNAVIDPVILDSKLQNETTDELASNRSRHLSDPPPLPPKPKHLPAKSSLWVSSNPSFRPPAEIVSTNARFVRPSEVKRDTKVCRNRRSVYLDQPSSSFV
ncbi:Regulator of G-protein signaling loco [Gryllus bimaculatus]|nr:Regulator of G-protein signaling loco [Gryllus bimaculatus]